MCGICVSVAFMKTKEDQKLNHFNSHTKKQLKECLLRRGPDSFNEFAQGYKETFDLYFCSSVLHLRGSHLIDQPVTDETNSVFMWNGEVFTEGLVNHRTESDTLFMARQMFNARSILDVLSRIEGPYAFVFYESSTGFLWFGRDIFGRRSLLWNFKESVFQLCSVAADIHEGKWQEVPTGSVFYVDLNVSHEKQAFVIHQFPYSRSASGNEQVQRSVELPVPNTVAEIKYHPDNYIPISKLKSLNRDLPETLSSESLLYSVTDLLNCKLTKRELFQKLLNIPEFKEEVNNFETVLSDSVKIRVKHQLNYCKKCYIEVVANNSISSCNHSYIGVLFSGGLDSLVIACLADRYVNPNCSVDLLNVAFAKESNVDGLKYGEIFDTPDRITGKMGFQALKYLFPSRKWNFVEINVTDTELNIKRKPHISQLLYPSCSVLDDSIGCALWFASRGKGYIAANDEFVPFQTSARVLLVGMGADEQLAGYSRHRAVFKNSSWQGLTDEISMELDRIGSRNLGRDDRIISDNGVESRYPFLDENVVSYLNSLPTWLKANLNLERGVGEKLLLRLLAFKLGLIDSAMLPKRAIQFGSRIAKLENSKEKGSDVCMRLLTAT